MRVFDGLASRDNLTHSQQSARQSKRRSKRRSRRNVLPASARAFVRPAPGYAPRQNAAALPQGGVAAFRKSLWAEHLGFTDARFDDPSSLECVRLVNEVGDENWDVYAGAEVMPLPSGHIMTYRMITVLPDGTVECAYDFPDFEGTTAEGKRGILPFKLTT